MLEAKIQIHPLDIPADLVVLECILFQTKSKALQQDIGAIHIYSSEIIQQSAVDKDGNFGQLWMVVYTAIIKI